MPTVPESMTSTGMFTRPAASLAASAVPDRPPEMWMADNGLVSPALGGKESLFKLAR